MGEGSKREHQGRRSKRIRKGEGIWEGRRNGKKKLRDCGNRKGEEVGAGRKGDRGIGNKGITYQEDFKYNRKEGA